jgi:hypothetical protein
MSVKLGAGERLGEDVRRVLVGVNVLELDVANSDALANPELDHVEVLGATMSGQIVGDRDTCGVVLEDGRRRGLEIEEVVVELSKSDDLFGGIAGGVHLRFGSRSGDEGLLLGTPGNNSSRHEDGMYLLTERRDLGLSAHEAHE